MFPMYNWTICSLTVYFFKYSLPVLAETTLFQHYEVQTNNQFNVKMYSFTFLFSYRFIQHSTPG